jgi:hypothetical protein
MAVAITLPTISFGALSGTIQLNLLDGNYAALVAALANLTNYANYFVDGGTAGALAITVPSSQTVAYQAGLPLQIIVANANTTSGATLTVTAGSTSLGAQNIVYPSGAAILPGQFAAGAVIQLQYNGTNFVYLGPIFGSGSFTCSWVGFSAPPAGSTITWSISALVATMTVPGGATGTSNSTSYKLGSVPSYLVPASGRIGDISVADGCLVDNGTAILVAGGSAAIAASDGVSAIVFSKNAASWTASGSKGTNSTFQLVFSL